MQIRMLYVAAAAVALFATTASAQQPGRQPAAGQSPGAPAGKAPAGGALKDQKQKVSYCFGLDIGRTLKMQAVDIDPQVLVKGLQDGLSGAAALLTDEQIQQVMQQFQQEMEARSAEKSKTMSVANKQQETQFLAANKAKQGIVALPSGLQYKVLKKGTGPTPKKSDLVQAHYRGTLLDGTVFDSSYDRGEAATFPVDGVIDGWKEALQLMPVGSKWQLFVPSELAYGERSPSPRIGPNAMLIFEVELLGIQPAEELPTQ